MDILKTQVGCLTSQGLEVPYLLLFYPPPQKAIQEAHAPLHAGSSGEKQPLRGHFTQ